MPLTSDTLAYPEHRPPRHHAENGATGWKFLTEHDPNNPGKWRPVGFLIVYPDHIMWTDLDDLATRDATLHAFDY